MSLLKKIFKRKFKSHLIDEKFRVEPAFEFEGVTYYHFPDQFQVPAGRQMMALGYYEELQQRVDRGYLEKFSKALDNILEDPKKISIKNIALLNEHLKERMKLLPMPDYIFRLGSVIFFDETESIYDYDYEYNQKKIEKWKKGGDVLSFFLQTPLKDLIRTWGFADINSRMYLPILGKIDRIHQENLTALSSEKV